MRSICKSTLNGGLLLGFILISQVILADGTGESYSGSPLDPTAPTLPADLTRQLTTGDVPMTDFMASLRQAVASEIGVDVSSPYFDDDIILLPNGAGVVIVSDYLKKMEDLQLGLKSYGQSLLAPKEVTAIAETVLPTDLLTGQGQDILGSIRDIDPSYMPKALTSTDVATAGKVAAADAAGATMKNLYESALSEDSTGFDPIPVLSLAPRLDLKSQTHKDWQANYGDADTLLAKASAVFVIRGDSTMTQAEGDALASMTIFNSTELNILDATGIVNAPKSGDVALDASIWVGGQTLYKTDEGGLNLPVLDLGDTKEVSIVNIQSKFMFAVGPIPMSAVLGATGSAGLDYDFHASAMHASVAVGPSIKADAYAEVGVDVGISRAGVGGSLNLVNSKSDLVATADLQFTANGDVSLVSGVTSDTTLSMLSGALYGFIEIPVPNPPFTAKYTRDIYRWNGITKEFGNTVNFKKIASPDSIVVQGDAEPEDYVATNLDTYETQMADGVVEDLNKNNPLVDTSTQQSLAALQDFTDKSLAGYWSSFTLWN